MRYLIMGVGALGTVFGGFLRRAGHAVDFIGRGRHFEVLCRQGLAIDGIWGEHRWGPIEGIPVDLANIQPYDVILLCVKSFDTEAACQRVRDLLVPRGLIISIQNGLGNLETIAQICGPNATIGARVIFGAQIRQPGIATVTVYADKVLLGALLPDNNRNRRLRQAVADLNKAGIPTRLEDNIITPIWEKVLYNCALNPLGAILGVTYGDLAASSDTRGLMFSLIEEIYQVAAVKQIPLSHTTAQSYFQHFLERLVPPTAAHYPSMLQDLQQGRRTEIEALNGAICRYGKQHRIRTPYNESITQLIRFRQTLAGVSK
ncbi:ketopantoate reductase family protein [Desulfobacca acetoxidans]|uniref:2-dehydropantoate 2-reductase n=1 Tax=Desulfobacca acetoxidans (strain ATCC 700848 / DSM 11109 / ASRB2) TaxID=880072 RepID=F2NHT8_DESAR|nr:ketopantoate reductase family protein [Desulfobacca acetoxidans]AEB09423.1 2-dehydropantoate 2-reductase [Desulfobacca acetoxidans DSM 11109]